MILGPNGIPVMSKEQRKEAARLCGRYGYRVNAFDLPEGAIQSEKMSFALHEQIKNNTQLRDRLEAAQRITGSKYLHLDMMDNSKTGLTADKKRAIETNVKFGEKIIKEV